MFVYEVMKLVHDKYFAEYCLKVITVDNSGERFPGEWLVDACITEKYDGFIDRIIFAMESESNTSKAAFNDDFAKLLHLNADFKLYLNGLNHKSEDGMNKYIESRVAYAKSILCRVSHTGKFFFGFWPSPGKLGDHQSAWKNCQNT